MKPSWPSRRWASCSPISMQFLPPMDSFKKRVSSPIYPTFDKVKRSRLTAETSVLDFAEFLHELPARAIILPSSAIFRRELALDIGGFPTNVKAEDSEFFLRLASRTVTGFLDARSLLICAILRRLPQIGSSIQFDFSFMITSCK